MSPGSWEDSPRCQFLDLLQATSPSLTKTRDPALWRKLCQLHRWSEWFRSSSGQPGRGTLPLFQGWSVLRWQDGSLLQTSSDTGCRPLGMLWRRKLWKFSWRRYDYNVCWYSLPWDPARIIWHKPDYRIPQMLHTLGCIIYSPSLEYHIRQLLPISNGDTWEVQLRGEMACLLCIFSIILYYMAQLSKSPLTILLPEQDAASGALSSCAAKSNVSTLGQKSMLF